MRTGEWLSQKASALVPLVSLQKGNVRRKRTSELELVLTGPVMKVAGTRIGSRTARLAISEPVQPNQCRGEGEDSLVSFDLGVAH
jgi:hypothetical protein